MTIDSKDIRDLTRAMKELGKAAAALNSTLVTIERNRLKEQVKYCRPCNGSLCVPGGRLPVDDDCKCCQVDHDPAALVASL